MKKTIMLVLTEDQTARLARGLGDLRIVDLKTETKLVHRFHSALTHRHDKRLADDLPVEIHADEEVTQLDLRGILPSD